MRVIRTGGWNEPPEERYEFSSQDEWEEFKDRNPELFQEENEETEEE